MLIGGKPSSGTGGERSEIFNPATGALIDSVPSASVEDIRSILDAAEKGKSEWAETPLHERCKTLMRYADLVDKEAESLARTLCVETGKPIKSARAELTRVGLMVRAYAERAAHLYGNVLPDSQPGMERDIIFTRREPLGIVLCVVPFNHPASLFTQKIAPALAMGNSIIVKPPSYNPLTVMRLTEILLEAGVPGNVAQTVTGSGSLIGEHLVSSPRIDVVTLTGSTEVGVIVAEQAAKNLHHVHLELGGNDALIIFDDVDLETAVDEVVVARAFNAGQTCAASKRLIIHNSIKDSFTELLVEKLGQLRIGDPQDPETDIGCLINERAALDVEDQVKHTVEQGARCILGGSPYDKTFFPMTVLVDVTPEMDVARDLEIFGPVFPIIGFDTAEEAVEIANSSIYGLMGGVMTADYKKALKVAARMECGGVVINGSGNYRPPELAFGGYKMSGIGREGVSATLEEMSQVKSIIMKGVF